MAVEQLGPGLQMGKNNMSGKPEQLLIGQPAMDHRLHYRHISLWKCTKLLQLVFKLFPQESLNKSFTFKEKCLTSSPTGGRKLRQVVEPKTTRTKYWSKQFFNLE